MTARAVLTLLLLAVACATTPNIDVARVTSLSIPMEVLKPDGAGPFPAIVMLHDCSGLGETRGHAGNPSPSRLEVGPFRRVADAYEALAYLRALPYVDGAHVGVMGGSHGGSTTLATIEKQHGFAAAIALYPGCNARPRWTKEYVPTAPLLILSGELDDWTPAAPCVALAESANRAHAFPVSIKVYPGAHHSFDNASPIRFNPARVNRNAPTGRGATTAGNPEAWADSRREVAAFFARYLRPSS